MNTSKNLFFALSIVALSFAHTCPAQNYCLQFDGVDDYVDVDDSTSLNPTAEITIETWIYPQTTGKDFVGIVEKDGYYGGQTGFGLFIKGDDGDLRAEVWGPYRGWDTPTGSITFGTWNHVVATYKSGEQKIYVNGIQKATSSATGSINSENNGILGIGARINDTAPANNHYFKGTIDEVAIYNRALTMEEILANIFGRLTGSEPNLVAYWKFDEGTGTIANDATGHGNTGTLYNDPCWVVSDLMNSIQPDLQIRTDDESTYTGDNIYNDLLAQTKNQVSGPNTTNIYDIRLENDRVAVDQFIVTGSAGGAYWDVNFYEVLSGNDVTVDITGAGWTTPILVSSGSLVLRLEATPKSGISDGNVLEEVIIATSISDANKSDAVKAATMFSATIPPPPWGAIYTTNADFDKGTLVGVEHQTVADQLQLSVESTTLPFIWVPNSNEGTVSKVDTRTGRELGRYRTGPSTNGNPSRTTVDLFGNCWVGNRNTGTVIKIGLLENGQYMDRNYNGIIETSRDLNDDGEITGNEILPWASDECVIYEVVLIPGSEGTYIPGQYQGSYPSDQWNPGPRSIAVDRYNNIWAGCYGSKKFYYIDGSNGQILKTIDVSSVNHTPYGAVLDENGILWSSGQDKKHVLRLNPVSDSFNTVVLPHHVYGLGLDRFGHLFISGWQDSKLSRINISTATVDWTKDGVYESRGVASTDDGDVWTANSGPGTVTRWTNDGVIKATIPVGNTPTGVAVDAEGKVWVVDYGDEYIHRIDPDTNSVDLSKRIIGTTHYGYSDMTGIVSRTATTRIGTWSVVHNTKQFDSPWGVVSWDSSEPRGTSLKVRVRSSNDREHWSYWEEVTNYAALRMTPEGRYLEVNATFQSVMEDATPILYDLTVNPSPCCGDLDHPYPRSDVNKDCWINFFDLAFMADEWLTCTAPECE